MSNSDPERVLRLLQSDTTIKARVREVNLLNQARAINEVINALSTVQLKRWVLLDMSLALAKPVCALVLLHSYYHVGPLTCEVYRRPRYLL